MPSLFELTTEEVVDLYKNKSAIDLRKDYEKEIVLKLESLKIKIEKCDTLIKKYENRVESIDESIEELMGQTIELKNSTPLAFRNTQDYLASKLELDTQMKHLRHRSNKAMTKLSKYIDYRKKFKDKICKRETKYKKIALEKFKVESPLINIGVDNG